MKDMGFITPEIEKEFLAAKDEIGIEEFYNHFCYKFGKPVLNFVKTLVVNIPGTCYANCSYCIDSCLRKNVIKSAARKPTGLSVG